MANLKICILDDPKQIKTVSYNGKEIRYVDYEGKRWVSINDFAVAAGYKAPPKAMYQITRENSLRVFKQWGGKGGAATGMWTLVNKDGIEAILRHKTFNHYDISRREVGRWILRELYGEDDRWVADSAFNRSAQPSLFDMSGRALQELEDRITERVYHRVMREIQGID